MKYIVTTSILLALIVGGAFTVSAATTTTTKTTVSSEVKIKTASQVKTEQKKKKLLERASLTKKLEELQAKFNTSAANLEVMKVKVQAVSVIDPKQYAKYSRLLTIARQKHEDLGKEIDTITAQIKKINTWLQANS